MKLNGTKRCYHAPYGIYRSLMVLLAGAPAVLAAGLVAVLWVGAAAGVLGAAPARADEDPALSQSVSATEEVATGQAVVAAGHVDLGPRTGPDGAWSLLARDDSGEQPVWRGLKDLVIHVPDSALMAAPEGTDFDFMGERAGQRWYVIPQVEAAGVPWGSASCSCSGLWRSGGGHVAWPPRSRRHGPRWPVARVSALPHLTRHLTPARARLSGEVSWHETPLAPPRPTPATH